MTDGESISVEYGEVGHGLMRRLKRLVETVAKHGCLTEGDYRFVGNLPGTLAAAAQEMLLGKPGNEYADPANPLQKFISPMEKRIAAWRRRINAALKLN